MQAAQPAQLPADEASFAEVNPDGWRHRITRPYSDCLYTPRSRSATDQMNPAWFLIAPPLIAPLLRLSLRRGRPADGPTGGGPAHPSAPIHL